jgi:ABC-type transporter lipoprotein component MlaA
MTKMNYVGPEFVERLAENFVQRLMNIAIFVIRHVDASYEHVWHYFIRFVTNGDVGLPGEFFSRKYQDLMALPGKFMA